MVLAHMALAHMALAPGVRRIARAEHGGEGGALPIAAFRHDRLSHQ